MGSIDTVSALVLPVVLQGIMAVPESSLPITLASLVVLA
jgi:hypothetical protein